MLRFEIKEKLPKESAEIRTNIFIQEQGFTVEFDTWDDQALHIVAYEDDTPIATARAYLSDGIYWIGRVAVIKEYRSKKIGAKMLQELENHIVQLGAKEIHLDAQTRVIPFYEKLGYCVCGEEHLDEFCPHREMKKQIKNN